MYVCIDTYTIHILYDYLRHNVSFKIIVPCFASVYPPIYDQIWWMAGMALVVAERCVPCVVRSPVSTRTPAGWTAIARRARWSHGLPCGSLTLDGVNRLAGYPEFKIAIENFVFVNYARLGKGECPSLCWITRGQHKELYYWSAWLVILQDCYLTGLNRTIHIYSLSGD